MNIWFDGLSLAICKWMEEDVLFRSKSETITYLDQDGRNNEKQSRK